MLLFRHGVRRVLACVGAVALLALAGLAAAGCGGSGKTSSSTGTAAGGHKPVTLTLGWWYDSKQGGYAKLLQLFEQKYPWIKVDAQTIPYNGYYQKLGAWTSTGSGPDVVVLEAGGLGAPYYRSMRALDVQAFRSELDKVTDPTVFCQDYDCAKGLYAIGFTRNGFPVYYNKDILRAAGLDPNRPPTTIREMAAACTAVRKIGKACWIIGGKDIMLDLILSEMGLRVATRAQMEALANGTAKWTDPEFKQLLSIVHYMGRQGWYQDGYVSTDALSQPAPFEAGKSAFMPGGMGDGLDWKDLGDVMGFDKIGVMNMPTVTPGDGTGATPGPLNDSLGVALSTSFAIPKWSKHPREAELLLRFTLDESVQKTIVAEPHGPFPGLKASQASWSPHPIFGDVLRMANDSRAADLLTYIGYGYLSTLNAQLQQLSLGQVSVDQAAEAIQKAADAARSK